MRRARSTKAAALEPAAALNSLPARRPQFQFPTTPPPQERSPRSDDRGTAARSSGGRLASRSAKPHRRGSHRLVRRERAVRDVSWSAVSRSAASQNPPKGSACADDPCPSLDVVDAERRSGARGSRPPPRARPDCVRLIHWHRCYRLAGLAACNCSPAAAAIADAPSRAAGVFGRTVTPSAACLV